MRPRGLIAAAALFMVGALATGLLRGSTSSSGPTSAPSTSSTTTPLAIWESPAEIVVPPVVIVPVSIEREGGSLTVDYELVSMVAGSEPAVRPTAWTLRTRDGDLSAEVDPATSRVVFDIGTDADVRSITGLRLDAYVLRTPLQTDFLPAADDFTAHEVAPGVTAALDIVQEQSAGTIVRVRLDADLLGATADLAAEGWGPGWVTASSNFGGGGLWTLSFDGAELPDPLPIRVRGIVWVPIETSLESSLEGVPIG